MSKQRLTFSAPPSAPRYMAKAFLPSPGFDARHGFPDLAVTWRGFRFESLALATLCELAGGGSPSNSSSLLLLPHVTGFRLLMVMLTHPMWPLPIWGALQVRNRLTLHRIPEATEGFDLSVSVSAWRVLEKGIEVDLQSKARLDSDLVWDSVVTFYYRGRYGQVMEHGTMLGTPQDQPTLSNTDDAPAEWHIDGSNRWIFGKLTGDYNGIHQWDWYARRFGFRSAFAHPQRVAAQCLVHLPQSELTPQRLDLWIKGPVYFESKVMLHKFADAAARAADFRLLVGTDDRPALVGSYRAGI